MRRIGIGVLSFVAFSTTVLALPVYAQPGPSAEPVRTAADEVPLGSIAAPATSADVQQGTTATVEGVAPTAPVLSFRRADAKPFSLVGVSWASDPRVSDTVVQVRVKDPAGRWGGWNQAGTDDSGQDAGASTSRRLRGGTEPLWTGPSTGVEVELVTRSGAQPTDVRLDLIDPGKSTADAAVAGPATNAATPTDTAGAATAMPTVFSRAQWGADPALMTWAPQYAATIKGAALHHTAGTNDYTPDQVPAILRAIYRYHSVDRGWGDIGYNALVDKWGRIWEGRAGGLASTVVGAHTLGFNTSTFGVAMIGNYDLEPPSSAMLTSVSAFMAWKLSLYKANPLGTATLVSGGTDKYPAGQSVVLPTIFGHRDTKSTECPGSYGYAALPAIRTQVAARTGDASFVRALYHDMMGRAADQRGLVSWTNVLAAGRGRRAVSAGIASSPEYRALVVTQAYQRVLNRAPDPAGLQSWLSALQDGRVRLDSIGTALMSSSEFYQRGGSTDAGFVDNIYQAALGRSAAASEVSYWGAVRTARGAPAVIYAVWGSPEAAMRRVGDAYQYYLGRTAVAAEREHWLPVVSRSGDEQLREELVVSNEYATRADRLYP